VSDPSCEEDEDSEPEVPVVRKSASPLDEACGEISQVITCLYKFSVAIRNPAPRDKLERLEEFNVSHFEFFDVQHVANKYSSVGENYLIERLGKANSRRRQLLMYYEGHHERIVGRRLPDASADSARDADYISETNSAMQTTVSTYIERDSEPINLDTQSETGVSQTSYASSVGGLGILCVPPPPDEDSALNGIAFECPYCHSMIVIENRLSWV